MRIVTDAGEEIIYEQLFEALLRRTAVETCYGPGERPTSVPCKACKLPLKVGRTGVIPWLCLYCKRRRNSAAYQRWYRRTYVERNLRLFGKKSTPTVRARASAWYEAHRKEVLAKRAEACAAKRAARPPQHCTDCGKQIAAGQLPSRSGLCQPCRKRVWRADRRAKGLPVT